MITPVNFHNFFNGANSKYPNAFKTWLLWLEVFRERVSWSDLFADNIVFGDLPGCLQAGMLVEFLKERQDFDSIQLSQFDMAQAFDDVFKAIELNLNQ